MAITLFGSASTPTDNGTNTTNPTAVTPPASMKAGDLVILFCWKRNAATGIAMSNTGGQTWLNLGAEGISSTAVLTTRNFYCIFNGTWSANPSVAFGATTNNNVVMVVFRCATGYRFINTRATNFTSNAAAASFTFGSGDTGAALNIANVCTHDDNTWNISGSNWVRTSLSNQYRNTSGSDSSCCIVYQILANGTASNDVTLTEATLGNDPSNTASSSFKEVPLPRHTPIGHPFIY